MKRHAILFVPLLLAAGIQTAQAQAVSQAWTDYRKGQETPAATPSQEPALPAAMEYRRAEYERHGQRDRGGFFIGAQAGKGWVYEDLDQNALGVNAGYRWQAGPIALLGIEVAAGRLADTNDDGWYAEEVKFRSIGFNGRFNFGARNPWYAVVRAGYFDADMRGDGWSENMDGGYAGFGIGVDLNRNVNLNLVYTAYVYADSYYYDYEWDYIEFNRADTVTFGIEARF